MAKDEDYAELEALVNWPLKQLINKWGVYHMYYDCHTASERKPGKNACPYGTRVL